MRAFLRRSVLFAVVSFVLAPTAVSAHSNSVTTDPEDGARMPTLPATASVTFNEPVSDAAFALTEPDGTVVKVRASIDGAIVTATLPRDSTKGAYVLAYRVVSEDGHPVTGEVDFTVTTGPVPTVVEATKQAPSKASSSTSWAADLPTFWLIIGGAVVLLAAAILLVRAGRR
jgi:methionine-rich copper-binding protein CopC